MYYKESAKSLFSCSFFSLFLKFINILTIVRTEIKKEDIMLQLNHPSIIQPQLSSLISKTGLKAMAEQYKHSPIPHTTDETCPRSPGTIHDFYSEGDYWWPDPQTPDGLPYIRRDGQTNPENFTGHRLILRQMRNQVSTLALAWKVSGDPSSQRVFC